MKYQEVFDEYMELVFVEFGEAIPTAEYSSFLGALKEKMEKGYHEYGDGVFSKDLVEILSEVSYEALDMVGWGLVAYAICQRDSSGSKIKQEILEVAADGLKNYFKIKNLEKTLLQAS